LAPARPAVLQYPTAPVGVVVTFAAVILMMWTITAWWVAFPPFLLVRVVARRLNIQSLGYQSDRFTA
jgi:hypothetical protein